MAAPAVIMLLCVSSSQQDHSVCILLTFGGLQFTSSTLDRHAKAANDGKIHLAAWKCLALEAP